MKSIKFPGNPMLVRVLIALLALAIAAVSVSSIKLTQMGTEDFFVESILPLPFWICVVVIGCMGFLALRYIGDKRSTALFILICICLIVGMRLAFPLMFTTIAAYEPDASNYLTVINSWAKMGIDFGVSGQYQHDYPLAYLIGYTFVKLGVPIDTFFRLAPFAIYAVNLVLIFFIARELDGQNKKFAAVSAFLFSFSSLGYWVSVHYCPDLVGSVFFFLTLLLSVRFAKKGEWSVKALAPLIACMVLLVLAHHLSTLYLILTLLGFALSTWFFKPPQIKGNALSFFVLGVVLYTMWFAYGAMMYPEFFNIYMYFSGGFSSPASQPQSAGLFNTVTFLMYPVFILILYAIEFLTLFKIRKPKDILTIRQRLRCVRITESSNFPFIFSAGFILVVLLFFVGFVAPATFPTRVLEVVCVGLFPLSSVSLLKMTDNMSSKRKAILLIIFIIILLGGIHRYYAQIQRRVII